MKGNKRRDTLPEVRLRSALHRQGLRFRKDYRIELPTLRVRADIAFPARRVAVFVDGCFWHGCPLHGSRPRRNVSYWQPKLERNRARDERVNTVLRDHGWTVVRVWEHEIAGEAVKTRAAALAKAVHASGRRVSAQATPRAASHGSTRAVT
jgi:DNA mismatch endonuclease (patch repair protein)